MNCKNCNTPLNQGEIFCHNCGTKNIENEQTNNFTKQQPMNNNLNPQQMNNFNQQQQPINNNPNPQSMNNFYQPPIENKKSNKKIIIIIIIAVVLGISSLIIISLLTATKASTEYLDQARTSAFADKATTAIAAVRNDMILNNYENKCYTLNDINELLELKLETSPFGTTFSNTSYVKAEKNQNYETNIYICLVDENGQGIPYTNEANINTSSVTTKVTCTLPPECN